MILDISKNIHSSQYWLHVIHLKMIKKNTHTSTVSQHLKENIQPTKPETKAE